MNDRDRLAEISKELNALDVERQIITERIIKEVSKETGIGEVFATGKAKDTVWFSHDSFFPYGELYNVADILEKVTSKSPALVAGQEVCLVLKGYQYLGTKDDPDYIEYDGYFWCDKETKELDVKIAENCANIIDIVWIKERIDIDRL